MVRSIGWKRGLALLILAFCQAASPAGAANLDTTPTRIAEPLTTEELLVLEAHRFGSELGNGTGFAVALSDDGTTALVGAPFDDCEVGSNCGEVRVLVRSGDTWVEQAPLTASDRAAGAEFGTSVALSGDGSIAVIGALRADCPTGSSCGAAYVFVRNNGQNWTEAQKLSGSGTDGTDFFGASVDASSDGSILLVGAPLNPCGGQIASCGAVYVFTRIGGIWIETARLNPSSPFGGDLFGDSVSLSDDGTIALIGAPWGGCAGQSCGEAYVFVRSGAIWTEERRFTAADADPIDQFGISVELSNDGSTALVGALSDDCAAGDQCGAAYVFTRSGGLWTELAKLTAPDNSGNDLFGFDVALAGDARHALIGAFGSCQVGVPCRLAYLFVEEGGLWREKQRLTAQRQCGILGFSVALSENADRAMVGVHSSTCFGGPGEAYVFGRVTLPLDVPVASSQGLVALALILAAIGAAMLRR